MQSHNRLSSANLLLLLLLLPVLLSVLLLVSSGVHAHIQSSNSTFAASPA
jgi:sensor domain CHASE-containing protein